MSEISQQLKKVLDSIRTVEKGSGRPQGSVQLVAVSKFHSAQSVIQAIEAGQSLFGENRVQEASAKFDEIRNLGYTPRLHMIGTLQRNKVKEAVRICECIESVDRIELLEEIEKQCAKTGKNIDILFEVHTGEESKAGFTDEKMLHEAVARCAKGDFPHIAPKGFMTMAPFTQDQALIRRSFTTLHTIRDSFQKEFPALSLTELSMGMSGDYPIAIEEGATLVRIGTAIFGSRA